MDKALKQRLVGASVIIALVVIVLPMLLGGRPESPAQQSEKIELPPRPDTLAFETRRFPVDEAQTPPEVEARPAVMPANRAPAVEASLPSEAEHGASTNSADESAPTLDENPSESAAVEPETAQTLPTEPAAEAATPAPEPAVNSATESAAQSPPSDTELAAMDPESAVSGRFLVQVASLGSAENATRLMTSLQEKGYPVLLDSVESEVGKLNRVRVGPYLSESEATHAVAAISKAFSDLNPKLVDLQPEASVPAAENPDSMARWVVQAGSFSEAVNADRLVAKLRTDGLNAYQEKVTSGSSVIFRVRIGPYLERETALKARQTLSESHSIDGVVVAAD